MSVAGEMLQTHPRGAGDLDPVKLQACLEACIECAQACTACADACLGEESVTDLVSCIRTDLDCADVCASTGRVLSRLTGARPEVVRAVLQACVVACRACGDECADHADRHEHCRVCTDACRRCEQACVDLLNSLD